MLSDITDHLEEVVFLLDSEYKILYASPAYEKLWGRTVQSLYDDWMSWIEAIHPDDLGKVNAASERQKTTGGEFNEEFRIKQPDGAIIWISDRVIPITDSSGKLYRLVGIVNDITERKKGEEKIKESERLLAEAQKMTHLGSWSRNLVTNEVSWSDELFRIFGLEPNKIKPTFDKLLTAIHPDDRVLLKKLNSKIIGKKEKSIDDLEFRIIRPNGEVRNIFAQGKVIYDNKGEPIEVIGVNLDITERKKAEEALKENEERHRSLIESLPDALVVHHEGIIRYVNAPAVKMLKAASPDALLGLNILDFFPSKDREIVVERGKKIRKGGKLPIAHVKMIRQDGTLIDIEGRTRQIEYGGERCAQVVITDVTERTRAEKTKIEVVAAKEDIRRLREIDKMKDEFLNITAHELKGPLMPVSAQVQLFLAGAFGKISTEQRESLEMMLRNVGTLNKLVSDLLDITRIKSRKLSLSREMISLEESIQEAISNLKSLAKEKQVTLSLKVGHLPKISADPERIIQVLTNLLDNALKFTPKKGKITVEGESQKDAILVRIKDTGIGISQNSLKKLFTPFFQINSPIIKEKGGLGLGLAICKGIVEAHRGKIWAESPGKNKGSTFNFTLPLK